MLDDSEELEPVSLEKRIELGLESMVPKNGGESVLITFCDCLELDVIVFSESVELNSI